MNKVIILFLGILIFSFSANDVNAQCKRFTEKQCLPSLVPFTSNGQIYTTTLYEGDSASMNMTFYSLLDYRLMVCSHSVLGEDVHFKVKDGDGEVVFNSKGKANNYWDFRVNSTQDLNIEVVIPDSEENLTDMVKSGCVSVILGFKE
jgi:hypothetical protein